MHSQQRRRQMVLFPIAAGLSALGTSLARGAERYPSKPIRMVVPFPAGAPPISWPARSGCYLAMRSNSPL